ncbi:MAG: aldehyde dehydrogenase family protein, partial [Clostridiales bacterium]|nr:aldehyde dehydrogenase family protein [Clostridiales bacterium]
MTELEKMGARARAAAKTLRTISADSKTTALEAVASAIIEHADTILSANAEDLTDAKANGMSESMQDRLLLTKERIGDMSAGVMAVSKWPEPVGKVLEEYDRPNGLHIKKVSVPLGVIGIIFESRPNVTSDCAALCIRAGNVVILRGGKEAYRSNLAITKVMRTALTGAGLPEDCVQLVTDTSRDSATEMMNLTGYLDVLIPRGGAGLIRSVVD